jgi:glycyl-tRNA synthetase beta chain
MSNSKSLLLEIGTEELPSSFVDAALAALPDLIRTELASLRLSHGQVHAFGTPRRLALLIRDVATSQPDLDEEVLGPPESAAFKDGKPTKAAEAFATKLGIPLEALSVVEKEANGKQKAGRYVVGRRKERGCDARELLGKALASVCARIPFRKSMRWGSLETTFGRPVQWLVGLFGDDIVDFSFAGVRSARTTRGHRFLAPLTFELGHADGYVDALRAKHVLVDRDERASTMMSRVAAAAIQAGGVHDDALMLVDENASLVEEPHVVTGSFDKKFLELPASVIRAVARGHQKYFSVQVNEDNLLPNYIAVVNTALDPVRIAKGNDRVMRARLSDAQFFFQEDRKVSLESRVEKLSGIVFHNRLGTVRQKVTRMERLASTIAEALHCDAATKTHVTRAAHLCKFDLVSLMVGEFPELQGDMGRVYATFAGEAPEVAGAIRDHYKPVGADGPVASDHVSACVALADRLDTLVGCFAIGLSPTGAADPFALRRACIATLRTLLDRARDDEAYASLSLADLFAWAYDGFDATTLSLPKEAAVAKVREFAFERLRGLISVATSTQVADAVCSAGALDHPVYAFARALAVHDAVKKESAWLGQARTVAKRLAGISKDSKPVFHPKESFQKADDAIVVDVVAKVDAATSALYTESAVRDALAQTEDFAARLDDIFTRTLVNDPEDARTPQRLEVLSYGAHCMLRLCDFARLA